VIEACRSEARRRLAEGDAIEGWTLKDGAVRESITDSEKVASRFLELGTYEQLAPAITLNKAKLKEAIKTATGFKGQQLTAKLDALLDGCTANPSNGTSPRVYADIPAICPKQPNHAGSSDAESAV